MADLVITNGDAAAQALAAAGLRGEIVAWRDVLHDGPVPLTDDLPALSALRTGFIAGRGWGTADAIATQFAARDDAILRAVEHERVLLVFEHDLYDQLQLLQVIDALTGHPAVVLVQSSGFLAHLPSRRLAALVARGVPLTADQSGIGRYAWDAFRQPRPDRWAGLLDYDISALPFLRAAVLRQLEEFPAAGHGLSRTEAETLRLIAERPRTVGDLFACVTEREEAGFMTDWSFFARIEALSAAGALQGLSQSFSPALAPEWAARYRATELHIAPHGRALLAGETDWRASAAEDWRGGVRLNGAACWRWDGALARLRPPPR